MPNRERLYELMERYQRRECSSAEEQELAYLCLLPGNQSVLEELAAQLWEEVEMGKEMPGAEDLLEKILRRPVVRKMMWWKVAVAVCLLVVGWWFLVRGPKSGESKVGGPGTEVVKNDVAAPQSSKAMVLLADGRRVSLDSLQNGLLADQDGMQLIKLADGSIKYKGEEPPTADLGLRTNLLTNPRGSQVINLTLSDGTRVWLNAGSSLRYPLSFATLATSAPSRLSREVEITGEAYFEVAHDATKPFIVNKGDMSVTVLGTHFNVNAYDDEADIRVTLLEGRVKVSRSPEASGPREIVLTPGQQAIATPDFGLRTSDHPDLDAVMAWKNGLFQFTDADIETVMRQLARWYDLEVVYENKPGKLFRGAVPRTMSIQKVFQVLEETGGVRFRIEGKKVVVMK